MVMNATTVYMVKRFMASLANTTMFTTYAIFYIATLGLNPFELLLVGMVLELSVLLFEGVTGVVADTYSRRLSIIIGMFLLGIGFALQGILPVLDGWLPFVSAFVWVLIAQLFLAWAIRSSVEPTQRGLWMKWARKSWAASLCARSVTRFWRICSESG